MTYEEKLKLLLERKNLLTELRIARVACELATERLGEKMNAYAELIESIPPGTFTDEEYKWSVPNTETGDEKC